MSRGPDNARLNRSLIGLLTLLTKHRAKGWTE
jgi:hypothetical protein